MSDIDRVRALMERENIGMLEARDRVILERMHEAVNAAATLDDIKVVLHQLIERRRP